jgi:hypothetical protein
MGSRLYPKGTTVHWAATGTAFASPYQFFQPANLAKGSDTVLKRQQVLQEGGTTAGIAYDV